MGDQLWMSRYFMHRVCEGFGVVCSFNPKSMSDWNGSSAQYTFSTLTMRKNGGIAAINAAVKKLSLKHEQHIAWYNPRGGKDNQHYLKGLHETVDIKKLPSKANIRIPHQVDNDGKGYLEDRRPASNSDPYRVTEALIRTTVLDDWKL